MKTRIRIRASYPDTCAACSGAVARGADIMWLKGAPRGANVLHYGCSEEGKSETRVREPEPEPKAAPAPQARQLPLPGLTIKDVLGPEPDTSSWVHEHTATVRPGPAFGTAYGKTLAKQGGRRAPPPWVKAKARKAGKEERAQERAAMPYGKRRPSLWCLSRIGLPFRGGLPHPPMSTMCCFTGEIVDGEWLSPRPLARG